MARQVGIHQIKGRYGTTSYYFRKRSKTGYLRSINQELSERVKTADNYAGTRIQNGEFKQAMACSWCITSGWSTLKKFYLYGDMSARLAAFFRDYYVPYIGSSYTDIQKARYLARLANFLNTSQKRYVSALQSLRFTTHVSYSPNQQTQRFGLNVIFEVEHSDFASQYFEKLFGKGSVVVLRAITIDFNGKSLPQYRTELELTWENVIDEKLGIDYTFEGSLLEPHIAWDSPLSSVLFVLEVVPVVNSFSRLSEATCVVALGYDNQG